MFADDTNIDVADGNIVDGKLSSDLTKVHEWLVANNLALISSKSKFMAVGSYWQISNLNKSSGVDIS